MERGMMMENKPDHKDIKSWATGEAADPGCRLDYPDVKYFLCGRQGR